MQDNGKAKKIARVESACAGSNSKREAQEALPGSEAKKSKTEAEPLAIQNGGEQFDTKSQQSGVGFLSPADEQWIQELRSRLEALMNLQAPNEGTEWRPFLSSKIAELKKVVTDARNRKRTCSRRRESCSTAVEMLGELETAATQSQKVLKMVGTPNFSGDEAIDLFTVLDAWFVLPVCD